MVRIQGRLTAAPANGMGERAPRTNRRLRAARPAATVAARGRLFAAALLLPWLAGCAGYFVGNATLFRPDIQTVYVPMFQSASFRPGLGERLTEAVVKEIELRTPYKVVGSLEKADSILSGRIVSETKRTVVENRYDDPRETAVQLQVEVQWVDQRGRELTPMQSVPLPPDLARIAAEATLVPEVGQSIATAHQTAIEQLARQIVGMLETPW
ncbi:MAG: LPS assembly lipoprotein LptE [Thermogutta sp.]